MTPDPTSALTAGDAPVRPRAMTHAEMWAVLTPPGDADLSSMSAFDAYVQRCEALPSLPQPEQAQLCVEFQMGLKARELLDGGKPLNATQRLKLRKIQRLGEEAIELLTVTNVRLVLRQVRKVCRDNEAFKRLMYDYEDLLAIGNLGLVQAAREFDPNDGPSFPGYATAFIRIRIQESVREDAAMVTPRGWQEIRRVASLLLEELEEAAGRPLTLEEKQKAVYNRCVEHFSGAVPDAIAATGDQEAIDEYILGRIRRAGYLDAIANLDRVMQGSRPDTLEAPDGLSDGSVADPRSMIADQESQRFEEPEATAVDQVSSVELRQTIAKLVMRLPDREREILLYKHGLHPNSPPPVDDQDPTLTNAQVGELVGYSGERVRQLLKSAYELLREPLAGRTDLLAEWRDTPKPPKPVNVDRELASAKGQRAHLLRHLKKRLATEDGKGGSDDDEGP